MLHIPTDFQKYAAALKRSVPADSGVLQRPEFCVLRVAAILLS